jgi:hypothetical protein
MSEPKRPWVAPRIGGYQAVLPPGFEVKYTTPLHKQVIAGLILSAVMIVMFFMGFIVGMRVGQAHNTHTTCLKVQTDAQNHYLGVKPC